MGDYDMSDVSESSWADARADTPTLGDNRSDSEDTLSNLSFDNLLDNQQDLVVDNHVEVENAGDAVIPKSNGQSPIEGEVEGRSLQKPPVPTPRGLKTSVVNSPKPGCSEVPVAPTVESPLSGEEALEGEGGALGALSASSSASFASAVNGSVRVCVTDADLDMADSITLDLPPGAQYMPTSVDLSRSPSQLKIQKGPTFMPKEDPGTFSEDESSISSYRAHLDLNLQNGDVRLTKKGFTSTPIESSSDAKQLTQIKPNFIIPQINFEDSTPSSEQGDFDEEDESLSIIIDDTSLANLDPSSADGLDDYIEDYILPLSHESVMSRQLSFRRKVQKTLETVAAERAAQELDRLDTMLSTYDEEEENNLNGTNSRSLTPDLQNNPNYIPTPPVAKTRRSKPSKNLENGLHHHNNHHPLSSMMNPTSMKLNFDLNASELEPPSLDIDAIVNENAPNLMGFNQYRKGSAGLESFPLGNGGGVADLESMSNYFLPQQTLDKLHAVYESSNFNNLYCLSGEIKNILSANEIEEIVANKDQLEKFIDPNVMAALSWSLNEASLPPYARDQPSMVIPTRDSVKDDTNVELTVKDLTLIENGLKSKSSSISNGFHSDASSCEDDNQSTTSSSGGRGSQVPNNDSSSGDRANIHSNKKTVPVRDQYGDDNDLSSNPGSPSPTEFQRGAPMTNSMRRKIALSKGMRSPGPRNLKNGDEANRSSSANNNNADGSSGDLSKRTSEESLDDLGVGDEDWEDDNETGDDKSNSSGVFLVRRDSKRFSFKGKDGVVMDRVIEGLFVESKNPNPMGTLRRVKLPLNLTSDDGEDDLGDDLDSPEESSFVGLNESEIEKYEAKTQKSQRKKISVDENILSVMSTDLDDASQATDVDATQSDVFHSIVNKTHTDDDDTMKTQSGEDEDEVTLDIDTPDDMEDSIMGQLESIVTSPMDRIPHLPNDDDVVDDSMRWKFFKVGPADVQIDLQAIQPYRKCLSHGGYFDAEKNIAIILFSSCYLPDRSRKEYTYLMDHLFLYVLSSLEELIVEDYILVYLHGATPKSCMPTYGWLKKCYQLINHRLRKNLKGLYLVHPTFWLRTVVALTRPFVSTKFSRKVRFINTLSDLCLEIPTEHLVIPDQVLQYDFDLKVDDLKRRKLMS